LVKPLGFVVDSVGIFEKLEAALAFDSDVVASVIENVDVLKDLFRRWMEQEAQPYLPFTRGWDDKAKERAIAHFEDKSRRDEFFRFAKQL
jgi:type I restriction enzyme, R subunit